MEARLCNSLGAILMSLLEEGSRHLNFRHHSHNLISCNLSSNREDREAAMPLIMIDHLLTWSMKKKDLSLSVECYQHC